MLLLLLLLLLSRLNITFPLQYLSYSCESEQPGASGPVAGSGRHGEGASEQSNANSSAAGSKRTRREESEQPGVSGPVAGSGRHREGESEQAHANVSDGRCPAEVVIVDGPDDSSVNKSAANGRRSLSTRPVIIDLDEEKEPTSSSLQKSKDDISCPEADAVSCLSMCEVC